MFLVLLFLKVSFLSLYNNFLVIKKEGVSSLSRVEKCFNSFSFVALVWRSSPIDRALYTKVEVRPLTQEEIEYLDLFTDYCKHTDNPIDYVKHNEDDDGQKHNL